MHTFELSKIPNDYIDMYSITSEGKPLEFDLKAVHIPYLSQWDNKQVNVSFFGKDKTQGLAELYSILYQMSTYLQEQPEYKGCKKFFFPIKYSSNPQYEPVLKCKSKQPIETKGRYNIKVAPFVWKNKGQYGISVKVVEYSKV